MRITLLVFLTLLLVITVPTGVRAVSAQENQPTVHAVLFWTNGCPYCTQTLTTILPVLQEKYKSQLSITLIELVSSADVDKFYTFGGALGLEKEQISVPFLLIDRSVLVGVEQINAKLPGLIENYLAAGGIAFPDLPILKEMLTKGVDFATSDLYLNSVAIAAVESKTIGFVLAWVVMAIMWIALILSIVMIARAFQGKPLSGLKGWGEIAIPILAVIGMGVSIYLTFVEVTHTRAICGPVGDCNAVQTSSYAKLFGFLPIGLVGAIGYLAILAVWLWQRFRQDAFTKITGPVLYGMALLGTLFSIYLTYLELFVIHAVCIWCLSSAVIITALMLLNLPSITQWLAISDEEE